MLQKHTTNHSKGKGKARTYPKADCRNQLLFLLWRPHEAVRRHTKHVSKTGKSHDFHDFLSFSNRFFKHGKPILSGYILLYIAQKRAKQPEKAKKSPKKRCQEKKLDFWTILFCSRFSFRSHSRSGQRHGQGARPPCDGAKSTHHNIYNTFHI